MESETTYSIQLNKRQIENVKHALISSSLEYRNIMKDWAEEFIDLWEMFYDVLEGGKR